MGGFVILLLIAAAVIALVIAFWIADQFYQAACMKGHDDKKYFWICFFFGIAGYLLVCALPTVNTAGTLDGTKPIKRTKPTIPLRNDENVSPNKEESDEPSVIDIDMVKKDRRDALIVIALLAVAVLVVAIAYFFG